MPLTRYENQRCRFRKASYPQAAKIPKAAKGSYSFEPEAADSNWLAVGAKSDTIKYSTDHVHEHQCMQGFCQSLFISNLPNGQTTAYPPLDGRILTSLHQQYGDWFQNCTSIEKYATSSQRAIGRTLSTTEEFVLAKLDDRLNTVKRSVCYSPNGGWLL